MYAGIDAVKQYWREGGKGCLGLHLEGPWINKEKRGAHIESIVHSPTITKVEELLAYGKGVIKMITLAPEVCNETIIEIIKQAGIIISAGHSNASFEEATHAFNNGIPTVTHLYNAMSPLSHRAPGMVGATFLHPTVYASIIPDGYHVHFEAVKIACKQMPNRLFAITDAVTTTHTGPYQHTLNGNKYESNGILSGSALTMHQAFKNLVNRVNINITDALAMCSTIPAKVLKLDDEIGYIKKNYKANIIMLNSELNIISCLD
jgi:N-acetylglucosamine-6-phosphate deacetylase